MKVGRVKFDCGLLNDLTLPPVVEGHVCAVRDSGVPARANSPLVSFSLQEEL